MADSKHSCLSSTIDITGGIGMSHKRLALNTDGQMTYCSAPPDKIGVGRCNHVAHQNPGESAQEFTERASIKCITLGYKKDYEDIVKNAFHDSMKYQDLNHLCFRIRMETGIAPFDESTFVGKDPDLIELYRKTEKEVQKLSLEVGAIKLNSDNKKEESSTHEPTEPENDNDHEDDLDDNEYVQEKRVGIHANTTNKDVKEFFEDLEKRQHTRPKDMVNPNKEDRGWIEVDPIRGVTHYRNFSNGSQMESWTNPYEKKAQWYEAEYNVIMGDKDSSKDKHKELAKLYNKMRRENKIYPKLGQKDYDFGEIEPEVVMFYGLLEKRMIEEKAKKKLAAKKAKETEQ